MTNFFVDKDESAKAVLGKKAYKNYCASGLSGNGFCVVSDKRLYFKGQCYYSDGGRYKKIIANNVVELGDYRFSNNIAYKTVPTIISFIMLIFSLIAVAVGYKLYKDSEAYISFENFQMVEHSVDTVQRGMSYAILAMAIVMGVLLLLCISNDKHLFQITFYGGKIAYDISSLRGEDIIKFQKKLDIIKVNDVENKKKEQEINKNEQVFQIEVYDALADELKRHAELLQAGAISQEEFEHVKKKILSNL